MKRASRHLPAEFCSVCVIAIALFCTGARAGAQTAPAAPAPVTPPPATLSFEVATIKPAAPFDPAKMGFRINQSRFIYTHTDLKLLIAFAYRAKLARISGPEWMDSEYYDIEAKIPEGASSWDNIEVMLQNLLKERFNLAFHVEKREGEVYALVVGKHGSRLKPSPPDPTQAEIDAPLKAGESYFGDTKMKQVTNKDGSTSSNMGKSGTSTTKFDAETMTMHMERSKMSMQELAGQLPAYMGSYGAGQYPVVDETGIKGYYQVTLDYAIGRPQPKAQASGNISDTIPADPQGTALDRSLDALGLKLELRKAPADFYVVDHVEKPSPN